MRRTASEVLRDLEIRVAKLEKQSLIDEMSTLGNVSRKIEEEYGIIIENPLYEGRLAPPSMKVLVPEPKDIEHSLRTKYPIPIAIVGGAYLGLGWKYK